MLFSTNGKKQEVEKQQICPNIFSQEGLKVPRPPAKGHCEEHMGNRADTLELLLPLPSGAARMHAAAHS